MLYISKGIVNPGSTEQLLNIAHSNNDFLLTGMKAELWLRGRFSFTSAQNNAEVAALSNLENMGLIETESEEGATAEYRILSRCVCCPAKVKSVNVAFSRLEKNILTWLRKAGLRLTVAELIMLTEKRIKPIEDLLYETNRQALVECIYTSGNIFDNILENQMEHAACRDAVVKALLHLLKRKMIIIL